MVDISRRRLFRNASIAKAPSVQRMPWLREDVIFTDVCSRCGKCQEACETKIIVKGDGGFPEVDFSKDECTFCGQCANVCPEPLFRSLQETPWDQVAEISEACLANQGVECRSCSDICEYSAIKFRLQYGGVAQLQLNLKDCIGCGACVKPCPTQAISIKSTGTANDISR
ncbi:ferredoxin-type protein NapF [Vibrio sp. SCSIO 43136]|uniref:ferredoxin-type protein NapF n=1 Tax=Vibrio sp. SCSIO 43136 TaxID=2819101 RepID=UPI002074EA2B|nr:ferredoxin-type protein NapF [Vibrio sp. SCSIO 43136]USD68272.1 ferredoxin-type protein NapF [Vibrio sp. SCSIO 43136]